MADPPEDDLRARVDRLDALVDLLLPYVPLSAFSPEVQQAIEALRRGDPGPVQAIAARSDPTEDDP